MATHNAVRIQVRRLRRPALFAALFAIPALGARDAQAQCGYTDEVLADNPVAYYRFEEAKGPVALDSSGNARHGTFIGAYTPDADGIQGGASRSACFSGASFVEVIDAVFASPWPALTVEAWVRISNPTTDFAAMLSSTSLQFVHFQLHSAGNNAVYTSGGTILAPILPQPADDVWHHIALVSTSGSTQLYVNGAPYAGAVATSFASITPAAGGYITMARGFQGARFLRGCLDEVAIYTAALAPERIAARYYAGINGLTVVSQPENETACGAGPATFSVGVAGIAPIAYRWQWQQAGEPGLWTDLVEGENADSGGIVRFTATDPSLAAVSLAPTAGMHGALTVIHAIRCVVTNACGSVTSDAAVLTVCAADFNCDATVNSTDVSDFINAWFTDQLKGTLVTDWDHNGVVNSTDVSEFINSWFEDIAAGCGN